jgi:outer membrane protein insertion porin family/translocation and assembly module TamA
MARPSFIRAATLCVVLVTLLGAAACDEKSGIKVSSLKFTGTQKVNDGALRAVLATASSSKLPWGEKRYFRREDFEADLKRIVAFYNDRGYPDARVTSFDVKMNEAQTAVDIVLNIDEGQPIIVERFDFLGFEPMREWRRNTLETRMPLKEGSPLDRALVQASREVALDQLRENGFPYASVRMGVNAGSNDRSRVITLLAEPGVMARVGTIEISGNSSVEDDVIRRQLAFRPGDVYRQSRLLDSQRKLYGLEVFEFANVEPVRKEGEQPEQIPVRVTVTEGKHRKVNFGLGYGSEERARAQVDWRHVNFFGGARTAGVLARYSSLDRGVRLNFNQPYLFTPRFSLGLTGQYWHNDEPAFVRDAVGGRVTVTRQFARASGRRLNARPATSLSFTYANEWEEYTIADEILRDPTQRDDLIALGLDPRFGEGRGQRSSIAIDAGRNTTDNLIDARRGYFANIHLEQAGRWLRGSYDYYELTGEGRYYINLGGRAVLAARARAGSIDNFGGESLEANVPFFKRYFLGGASNLRGWGRFEVAPLSGGGLPIGGHTFADFSTEVRVPIWRQLSGVVFFDGGNVWREPWDFKLGDMRYDAGPGLRYNTPIGPLRVDVGYQLNPVPGLLVNGKEQARRLRFHFSIGQAF